MACNENVVKNMANEITRNCQAYFVNVDSEFVIYLIDLLLLNPKYGKLFAKTIKRNNLAYFVEECVNTISHGGIALSTLKMQFILQKNYNNLHFLIDNHRNHISNSIHPLFNEILAADPDITNDDECMKLFRKISIYMILATGLGKPEHIVSIKEGIAALESVFQLEDLHNFLTLHRFEKIPQLEKLTAIVAGVKLFNRSCKRGGDGIPDLTTILVDSGKNCTGLLSKTLIRVMQRVNTLTTAISDSVVIEEETGNVIIDIARNSGVSIDDYKEIFDLLCFNRQYEVIIRKLIADVQLMTKKGTEYVEKVKAVLEELNTAVKYKAAVPIQNVFPLFTRLWHVWSAMQDVMYLVSTINRLISVFHSIQENIKIPYKVVMTMLNDRSVVTDQSRYDEGPTTNERISLATLHNYVSPTISDSKKVPEETFENRKCEFLGFCALCLNVGALVPSNMKIGAIREKGLFYGFCNVKMAIRFSKEPQRYINEVLNYARNNPQIINLLNISHKVYEVKDVDELVVIRVPKVQMFNKNIQTEIHPHDENVDKEYSWNLWDWKRKACQWASIVHCQTHSTQTAYSHLRSDIQCQTTEHRDKCFQTKTDSSTNTIPMKTFIWGLRGQIGYGQHALSLTETHSPPKQKEKVVMYTSPVWKPFEMSDTSIYNAFEVNASKNKCVQGLKEDFR